MTTNGGRTWSDVKSIQTAGSGGDPPGISYDVTERERFHLLQEVKCRYFIREAASILYVFEDGKR